MNTLPDEMIVTAVRSGYKRKRIPVRMITVLAACLVIMIAAAVYPRLRTQKPEISEPPVSTAETTVETGTEPQTETVQTTLSKEAFSGTSCTASQTTTVTTAVSSATGTVRTTATVTAAPAAGTAIPSQTTPPRNVETETTSRHTTAVPANRHTTAASASQSPATTTAPTQSRTTPTTTRTDITNPFTTSDDSSTTAHSASSTIVTITELTHEECSLPIFRCPTTVTEPADLPDTFSESYSILTSDDLRFWQNAGIIPQAADLSGYDLIQIDVYGPSKGASLSLSWREGGIFWFDIHYMEEPEDRRTHAFRMTNIIAVPKKYGITPERCRAALWPVCYEEIFESLMDEECDEITCYIYP